MKTKSLEEFVRCVKDRAYDLKVRVGNKVFVSVFFINNGQKLTVINKQERKSLSKLGNLIVLEKPDLVEVEILSNRRSTIYSYEPTLRGSKHIENNHNINVPIVNTPTIFDGFGSVEHQNIERIVNKRLEEERKERELTELKAKVKENAETLLAKEKEVEKIKTELEDKKSEIEDLEKIIETKRTFKYFAGLTGDILESVGIKKELIAKPLAGLLSGGKTTEEPKAIGENTNTDNSGIVDDEVQEVKGTQSVNDKRNEMIALISEFLKGVDNHTLNNIFSIFSEIENQPNISNQIIEFLKIK